MAEQEKPDRKKPGRAGASLDFLVGVRLPPDLLARLDDYRSQLTDAPSRPEAIRRLLAEALAAGERR
jgi:hypothetical protein